jgi:hypothetical protein
MGYKMDKRKKKWTIERRLNRSKQFKKLYNSGIKMGYKKKNQMWKKRETEMWAEKNPQWKGDKVGYEGLHSWVRRNKPKPEFCEICNKRKPYDLANISGEYKRDINDFKWGCRKCHMKSDGRYDIAINNLKKAEKKRDKNGRYLPHEK